ncbi:uncharacterized protein C8A04DRAFT_12921 [Dichotomopilus funicola]|uniref:Protamine P1 n=1 Tax=Dichotomopilus funicola TaxID=1934379 RepID=A0AAN6ZML4_9PEZI|nr:hypothetical protein C8A04DRAFT_12921 [Dichotomopilus funicola]
MKHRAGAPDLEWLHPENFCNEQLYCETPHHPDDVLYEGSDDETYTNSEERRARYADQARRFLKGQPVFLLSASLRGPFDQESGWVNPWRSKSGESRSKLTTGTKPPVPERVVVQVEANGISESSSPCEEREIAETQLTLPRTTYEPPLYLDDDALYRVQHWRDRVVAESDAQAGSGRGSSQSASNSVDSRKATQHTTNRTPSGSRPVAVNNSQEVSSLNTPGVVDQMRQRIDAQRSQDHNSSELSPPPSDLEDPHALSPHAVRIYGQLALSAQIDAVDTTSFENTPVETPSRRRTIFEERFQEEENVTPAPALALEAVSSALVKTEASERADGSFCYQTKGVGRKGAARRKSKLVGSPKAPTEATDSGEPEPQAPPERAGGDVLGLGPNVGTVADKPFIKTEDVPDDEAATATPHPATNPQPESESAATSNSGTSEQCQVQIKVEFDDSTQSSLPIDGPTLVPSQSPSHSDYDSVPSFGHFSVEKHSQEMISDTIDFPRRLLWPKSRRSQDQSPATLFGRERLHTPASLRSGPSTRDSRAASSDYSPVPEATVHESASNNETGVQTEQRDGHVNEAVSEMEAGPASAPTTDIKTEDQIVQEDMQEPGLPQVELHPASDEEGDAMNSQPPASCPQPQTQSPWVQDDRPVRPNSQGDHHHSHHSHHHHHHHHHHHPHLQSSPKPIQSPWVKMVDVVPDVSGTVAQLPNSSSHSHPAAATPSLTSAQNLQTTTMLQSPWARGDLQMQLPDVRLFNPLSSPANTHVLPATDPSLPRSPVLPTLRDGSNNNDAEVANSQLYPLPPSTPETKQSSLPTPDVTLSVKSFKNFMTPSPQRPPAAKRRRILTDADGALPSTQALVDAAISNPWIRPPTEARPPKRQRSQHRQSSQAARPRKRVSWGPLPGEEDNEDEGNQTPDDPEPIPAPAPTSTTNPPSSFSSSSRKRKLNPSTPHSHAHAHDHPRRARPTSPPPSILSSSSLPSTNQKFGKHFAAVAGRRVGSTPLLQRTPAAATAEMLMRRGVVASKSLLPSGSQQTCGSPAVDAMAEAFLRAERVGGGGDGDENASEGVSASALGVLGTETGGGGEQAVTDNERGGQGDHEEGYDDDDEQEEGNNTQDEDEGTTEPEPEPEAIDEVSAVMENLDDFLGGNWDLDADLAQAKAEQGRNQNQAQAGSSSQGGGGLSGLMDVGVWD